MNAAYQQPIFIDAPTTQAACYHAMLPSWLYRTRWHAAIAAAILSILVCGLDIVAGREFQVVPLYLLPVALAAWIAGKRAGIIMALLCAGLWLDADLIGGASDVHHIAPYTNALGLFITFATFSWIVCRLHVAMHSLEETVQRRTSALLAEMGHRQRAEEARVHAERLAIVGTMSAQLAHEVRNPLGSIKLNIDLLNHEIDELAATSTHSVEESHALLTQFRQEVQRIKQVVDGCTGLVRQRRLDVRPLFVHEFLDKQLRLVRGELSAANVQVKHDYDPHVHSIDCDGTRLWEAMLNLISNARQAMTDGGDLTVRTKLTDDELHISIEDTGCGITPENMEKLYTPFFTTKPDGTGLGLVLVHQVVNEMGGHLSCKSEPGKGTTFTIMLPRKRTLVPPEHSGPQCVA